MGMKTTQFIKLKRYRGIGKFVRNFTCILIIYLIWPMLSKFFPSHICSPYYLTHTGSNVFNIGHRTKKRWNRKNASYIYIYIYEGSQNLPFELPGWVLKFSGNTRVPVLVWTQWYLYLFLIHKCLKYNKNVHRNRRIKIKTVLEREEREERSHLH